jgi:PEP-CTERM motif
MKSHSLLIQTALILSALAACGQGTFIYDQSSATNQGFGGGYAFQQEQPFGQSFTPSLTSIGFVQMEFISGPPQLGGATVYVNLRADSIGGPILSSTDPVFMPYPFAHGITNFFFPTLVAITPGTTYYLQPVVQAGNDQWGVIGGPYNYPGGTLFWNGAPDPNGNDAWFREGTFVPEPSSGVLVLLGIAGMCAARRVRRFRTGCQATVLIGLLASAGAASAQLQIGERVLSPPWMASFHSMQRSAYPPLPCLPFDVPVYRIVGKTNSYAFDDRDINYDEMEQAQRAAQAQASLSMSGIRGQTPDGPDPLDYGTNLYLQIALAEISPASLSGS